MTYEEDVREALKQGPGSVRQIVARIPRASENGVRRALRRMEARGEARILRFERLTPYAYAPIWEVIE
jgi:hypothetical protein